MGEWNIYWAASTGKEKDAQYFLRPFLQFQQLLRRYNYLGQSGGILTLQEESPFVEFKERIFKEQLIARKIHFQREEVNFLF